jgi:hypothetical protein
MFFDEVKALRQDMEETKKLIKHNILMPKPVSGCEPNDSLAPFHVDPCGERKAPGTLTVPNAFETLPRPVDETSMKHRLSQRIRNHQRLLK